MSQPKPALPAKPAMTASAPRRAVGGAKLWQADAGGVAALLGVSALAYFFGVVPVLERHALVQQQTAELTELREKSIESAKLLDATRKQLATSRAELEATPLQLQPLGQLNRRLATVADIAARSGATLDDLQPGKPGSGALFDAMPVHVTGVATYPAFAGLLHRIRAEFPDAGIDGFDITANGPTGNSPTAKFTFDLVWYTRPLAAVNASHAPSPKR